MSDVLVLALLVVAAILAVVTLVQTRGQALVGWACLALAAALLIVDGVVKL